ncbi:MAG TPA: DNA primase [Gemmatimonadaceae bacterium]|nr:DNA primase [Gemmatimonadaceae bacterium]
MIPDETVERVREAADLVEIVGLHVKLRRMGGDWRGPCPFHQGKNPNFAVSSRRNSYYCFKCGAKGDVFSFVREHLGLDFVEAVKYVGAQAGVEVREVTARRPQERDPREPLWEALAAAAEYFQRLLWDDAAAAPARRYLEERALSREVADAFGLGFAPRDPAALQAHLHALGHDDERLLAAGLLVRREDEPDARPRFRGRLTFPILDGSGRHVGFGARIIGEGEPKYLNSPQSAVFDKGGLLYGLQWARHAIRKADRALVVEGYMDAIRLANAGLDEVVAPLGTALTEAQAALLVRYTKNVFLLYDSDEAGQKATFRSGLELLRHGVSVRVVTLPEGEDPDSFVARHGAERMEGQLSQAMDVFDRQVQMLERRGWFADLHRKRRAVDKLLPTIRAASDPVTRDLYLTRLSEAAHVDRQVLQHEAEAPEPRRGPPSRGAAERAGERASAPMADHGPPPDDQRPPDLDIHQRFPSRPGQRPRGKGKWKERRGDEWLAELRPPRPGDVTGLAAERALVLVMLHKADLAEAIVEAIAQASWEPPEPFRNAVNAELFAALSSHGATADLERLSEELSSAATAELDRLLAAKGELVDPQALVRDSLAQLRGRSLSDEVAELEQAREHATGDQRAALDVELLRLKREVRALGGRGYNWYGRLGS